MYVHAHELNCADTLRICVCVCVRERERERERENASGYLVVPATSDEEGRRQSSRAKFEAANTVIWW